MTCNLQEKHQKIIVAGLHAPIIQSILDFDYMAGVSVPSVAAIIGGQKKSHKFWFGNQEVLIPIFSAFCEASNHGVCCQWLLNAKSGNSAKKTTVDFFSVYPEAQGAHIFAEKVPEQDALHLVELYGKSKYIAGPSGVGLLIPGALKLGAIGGIYGGNLQTLATSSGNTAIICSSGGMVNELIDSVLRFGGAPSLAVSYGGEKFPASSPLDWCLAAELNTETDQIIFFGELGGHDEYKIAAAVKDGKIKKPVYAYIAGHYNSKEERVQFGHAKALANAPEETALSKAIAMKDAGVTVSDSYADFMQSIKGLDHKKKQIAVARAWRAPDSSRRQSLFTAVKDRGSSSDSFVKHALSVLLEKKNISPELVDFTELVFSQLIDHGAEVSGAVNTMISARAGRDISSSLASGILTIGDRFGGAINGAAEVWFDSVKTQTDALTLLEKQKQKGEYILGIGHLKYSIHKPDPRVESLISFAKENLKLTNYLDYATSVAEQTSKKRANLILNIDGAIAAILLDILVTKEKLTENEIGQLIQIEFFNAFFIIPRTVGFIGNFLSQKRRDEGLFRLSSEDVFYE